MSPDQRTKSLEERIAALEKQNEEFRRRLGLPGTDVTDLLNAIDLMIECRDTSALDDFLKRGGKIPVNGHSARALQGSGGGNPEESEASV